MGYAPRGGRKPSARTIKLAKAAIVHSKDSAVFSANIALTAKGTVVFIALIASAPANAPNTT